jgi:hypothetical protein
MAQFDTFLIGRKTFEAMVKMGSYAESTSGIQNIVFSRTLRQAITRMSSCNLTPRVS